MSLVRFAPPQTERTVAGDIVTTRAGRFASQADQIRFLREMVEVYRGAAAIRARARDIVFRRYNCPPRNEVAYALAIARWTQASITYVKELPEVFQTPTTTIALGYGDCDDMSTVIGSLCEGVGIETELVGLEWDAPPGCGVKRAFQHIFPRAVIGKWKVPLDVTLQRPIELMTDPIRLGRERGLRLRTFIA